MAACAADTYRPHYTQTTALSVGVVSITTMVSLSFSCATFRSFRCYHIALHCMQILIPILMLRYVLFAVERRDVMREMNHQLPGVTVLTVSHSLSSLSV